MVTFYGTISTIPVAASTIATIADIVVMMRMKNAVVAVVEMLLLLFLKNHGARTVKKRVKF